MMFPAHLVLAAALLASSPAAATPDAADQATKAQMMAGLYGRILGAASQCQSIAPGRVDALTKKVSAHLKSIARDDADASIAGQRLLDAVDDGKREVSSGRTTCAQAAAELDNLAHELSLRPLTLPKAGAAQAK